MYTEHYLSPADWRAFTSDLRERSTAANREVQLRARDGKPVWVLESATLTQSNTRRPIIEGSLVDITHRKQSEEDLRQAHEDLRTGPRGTGGARSRADCGIGQSQRSSAR